MKPRTIPRIRERFRVSVFYDGRCLFCRRTMATLKRLDWLGVLEPVSFRDPGVIERFGLDPARAAARLHARNAGGPAPVEGIDAVILIATRLPPVWPAVPLLWIAARLGWGQRVYDWIAARRTIIPAGPSHGGYSEDS
jgi:predicted DCC family thiol-disulfide oxidoreductase YuxK